MLLRKNDWKQFLSIQDEEKLNEFLKKIAKYRGAYKNADDVKSAQLWCAVLELKKETLILQKRIDKIQYLLEGMFERVKIQEEDNKKLIESLERF